MKILKIDFPTDLSKIQDVENDNVDVFVTLDDGLTYSLVVTTPNNYYRLMDKEKTDFISAAPPSIIVRKLTEEIIGKAVESYLADNAYWLKLYFLAGNRSNAFEVARMDKMIEDIKKSNEEIANS
ncbi:hypothetical protein [Cohnella cellulosilytica]|uniref:hypothetical protein n=1 Tax=Cohnella cellulosilytica TaxID=986710 RepID=UPI0035EC4409